MNAEQISQYQSEMRRMEQEDEIRFYYFRSDNNSNGPVLTACAILNQQTNDGPDVSVGFAFCSKKDRFIKSIGRIEAFARAMGNEPFKNGVQPFGVKKWSGNSQNDAMEIFNNMNHHNLPNPFKKWKLVKYTDVYVDRR